MYLVLVFSFTKIKNLYLYIQVQGLVFQTLYFDKMTRIYTSTDRIVHDHLVHFGPVDQLAVLVCASNGIPEILVFRQFFRSDSFVKLEKSFLFFIHRGF